MESLYIGCVSSSLKHFPDGRIDKKSLKAAALEARHELAAVSRSYLRSGWQEAVGSSGSARSIESILVDNKWAAQRHHARRPRQAVGPPDRRRPRRP